MGTPTERDGAGCGAGGGEAAAGPVGPWAAGQARRCAGDGGSRCVCARRPAGRKADHATACILRPLPRIHQILRVGGGWLAREAAHGPGLAGSFHRDRPGLFQQPPPACRARQSKGLLKGQGASVPYLGDGLDGGGGDSERGGFEIRVGVGLGG
jgi:hypothetical protein